MARTGKPETHTRPVKSKTARKVMVLVHGAGHFPSDYFKPCILEIEKRLGKPFDYLAVYYADLTNPPASVTPLAAPVESPEAVRFKAALQKELQRAYDAIPPGERPARITAFSLPGAIDVFTSVSKEVVHYLFTPNVKSLIQARLTAALDEAMKLYEEIIVVSHSLGSVVAFDVLKQFADRYNAISYWFTTGSPLAKLRRLGARDAGLGAITRQNVGHWYNIFDSTDIIADAIGSAFPKPGYRIHDIYVDVAVNPNASHDYLNNAETLDMIADLLR